MDLRFDRELSGDLSDDLEYGKGVSPVFVSVDVASE